MNFVFEALEIYDQICDSRFVLALRQGSAFGFLGGGRGFGIEFGRWAFGAFLVGKLREWVEGVGGKI